MNKKPLIGVSICAVVLLTLGSNIPPLAYSFPITSLVGETIYVDDNNSAGPWNGTPEHPYQHIQDGMDHASAEDTVFVFAGHYHERVNVTKTIHLLGENNTRTIISSIGEGWSKPVLNIYSDGVVVLNFTINITTGSGSDIILNKASYCKISNNIIQGKYAITIGNSSNNNEICYNLIQSIYGSSIGNYMHSNSTFGNYVHHNHFDSSGVELNGKYTSNNIISDNFFDKCDDEAAILTNDVKDNIIERNIIIGDPTKDESGIHLNWIFEPFLGGNIVRYNIIKNCSGGGIITQTRQDTITDNIIENGGYGLSICAGPYNTIIRNNTVRGCQVGQDIRYGDISTILEGNLYEHCIEGIEVWYCTNTTFTKNTFRNNTYGVTCHVSHKNNFYRNNFEDNHIDVLNAISRNHWLLNYWDQPRILPKPLFGYLPFIQFDWHPALLPQ